MPDSLALTKGAQNRDPSRVHDSPPSSSALAPAAGSGIGKQVAEKLLNDSEFVDLMIEAAKGGLQAERSQWTKGPDGKSELITEPDHKTRLQAFALLLAHMEGEPIRRQIVQHLGGEGPINPLAALESSAALRDAALHLVEKANRNVAKAARAARHAVPEITIDG